MSTYLNLFHFLNIRKTSCLFFMHDGKWEGRLEGQYAKSNWARITNNIEDCVWAIDENIPKVIAQIEKKLSSGVFRPHSGNWESASLLKPMNTLTSPLVNFCDASAKVHLSGKTPDGWSLTHKHTDVTYVIGDCPDKQHDWVPVRPLNSTTPTRIEDILQVYTEHRQQFSDRIPTPTECYNFAKLLEEQGIKAHEVISALEQARTPKIVSPLVALEEECHWNLVGGTAQDRPLLAISSGTDRTMGLTIKASGVGITGILKKLMSIKAKCLSESYGRIDKNGNLQEITSPSAADIRLPSWISQVQEKAVELDF